ncbi:tetratricopeptide repeat protein [Deinococcus aquiradiocola]|uniref:Tetratricopeptide repeat protein n=1 Tax=Deinococcus aquiradiocola TaxID=393059 RepID=A0A917UPI8_9DEIO|nr:tetratricopeptide repeat protein [Deinococcus aquiradiocola]GGJ72431.1 hypothetical protein GCM10008939_16050 [Deinococcus aquiradiocola]
MTAEPAAPHGGPAPTPQPELNLDWAGYLRAGEYRRALAAARVGNADMPVQDALEVLFDLQEAVRARRLLVAQRLAERLPDLLNDMGAADARTLREHAPPDALHAALEALLGADRERLSDDAALRERLQPALTQPLTRAEALNTLGVLHALQDREGQARQSFGEAIAHDPGHYRALTNLGNMALEGGDAAGAETLYRQSIALNADYSGAQHNLGVALRRQGRLAESVKAIKKGQRLAVRQSQREQQDELKGDPRTRKAVQTARIVMLVLVVIVVLFIVRGHV